MARVLSFLIRYFSNYYTLHLSDLTARAAPLDPRLKLHLFLFESVLCFPLVVMLVAIVAMNGVLLQRYQPYSLKSLCLDPLPQTFTFNPFFQIYLSRKRKHLFIEFLLWEIIKVIVSNLLKNVIKFYFQNNILILIKISKKSGCFIRSKKNSISRMNE